MVTSLWYTLNGPSENDSMLGPDRRRLWADGDFNVEFDFADLPGANVVEIIAPGRRQPGDRRKTVTVNYLTGNDWPQNYFVDWTDAPNVQAKAQVVDGLWTTDANRAALRNDGL
jgi:hypothetical protein